jgi:type II secretory pathway pseudopilin PulG
MRLQGQRAFTGERGYAMAALLVSMSVMAVLMTAVMPVWKQTAQREKEAELVFRGQQYVHAIQMFQRRSGPGTYPPSLDFLVQQKFLRKRYKDPITNADFLPVPAVSAATPIPGGLARGSTSGSPSGFAPASITQPQVGAGGAVPGGVAGVVSKSTDASIRIYNGQTHYNEWVFRALAPAAAAGGGAAGPGGRGQRGAGPGAPNQPPGIGGQGGLGGGRGQRGGPPAGGRFGGGPPNGPPQGGAPNGRGFGQPPAR